MTSDQTHQAIWAELSPQLEKEAEVIQQNRMHHQLRHVAATLIERNPHQALKDPTGDFDPMPETPRDSPSRQSWWQHGVSVDDLKAELQGHVDSGNMSEVIRVAAAIDFKEAISARSSQ